MSPQHLSDEAVAAFADGVLRGRARERAATHTAECAECAHAVAVQREAVWALRAAPAPSLPSGLLDRLREVPTTTVLQTLPLESSSALDRDGSFLFAAAAFVGDRPHQPHRPHREQRGAQDDQHRQENRSRAARLIDPLRQSFRRS